MADDYELGAVGPIPTVNPNVAKIGEMLKIAKNYADQYYVKENVPLIGGTTLGEFILGKAPEEIERWGQGDYPVRNPSEVVKTGGNRADIWKTGRFEPTFDVATNVALPLVGAAKATKGMPAGLSIMGPESKLWNKEMAFNAGKMEAKGLTPEEIYKNTGMVRGLDNQWRMELSDKFAKLKQKGASFGEQYMAAKDIDPWSVFINKAEEAKYGRSPPELHKMTNKQFDEYKDFRLKTLDEHKALEQKKITVNDVLDHPQLLEAYPHLGDIRVEVGSGHGGQRGSYNHNKNTITLSESLNPEEARSTLLHELTHGIQAKEGFNRGGNPDMFTHQDLAQELKKIVQTRDIFDRIRAGNPDLTDKELIEKVNKLYSTSPEMHRPTDYTFEHILDRNTWPNEIATKIVKDYGLDSNRAFPYTKEEMYKNLAGEAEARLVQNRADLSQEELFQHFPYQYNPKNHGMDIDPDIANVISDNGQLINQPFLSYDYRGTHTAPYKTEDATAPGHQLDKIYPNDVYGPNGARYYGHGGDTPNMDSDTLKILNAAKGNPEHPITVYRAVPGEFKGSEINPGDWVTPNLDYAHEHGKRFDDYHVIEKTVPAKHIWTDANSIHEFGYDPSE